MLYLIADGILLGLTLTILFGPIFVALTYTGINYGTRAGITVGSGIWTSDLIVILLAYFFIRKVETLVSDPNFRIWMGMVGGIILIMSGIITTLKKNDINQQKILLNAKNYFGFWSKGFIVNTFNPFTFIFWLSVMSTYIIGKSISGIEAIVLFGSVLSTIMVTDTIKVVFAKMIKNRLTPNHIAIFSKISGILLCIFGLVLIIRTVI